ncbi:hypothetical protein O3M35_011865 [Rhynocoris fuscipes]|uniref:Uncharacterized protein n=1 Tax=Rhynocoris fuscipes TaxID=488301 RepID=A0AAW1CY59_9HEMI
MKTVNKIIKGYIRGRRLRGWGAYVFRVRAVGGGTRKTGDGGRAFWESECVVGGSGHLGGCAQEKEAGAQCINVAPEH